MTTAATRSVPRFLPTLTEVVLPTHPVAVVEPESPVPELDPEAIVARVRAELDQLLSSRLEASLSNALLDHVPALAARIREDIEPLVRQAVADAVAAELAQVAAA